MPNHFTVPIDQLGNPFDRTRQRNTDLETRTDNNLNNVALEPNRFSAPVGSSSLDPAISDFYKRVADEGIFGQEGLDKINTSIRAARDRRNLRLTTSLRKRASRRFGTRSGTVDQIALNATGQAIAGEQEFKGRLLQANEVSKFQGIQGLFDLARFDESKRQFDKGLEFQESQSEGGGFSFLDLVNIGTRAYAAFATGGTSEVALRV